MLTITSAVAVDSASWVEITSIVIKLEDSPIINRICIPKMLKTESLSNPAFYELFRQ